MSDQPAPPAIRASDAERQHTIGVLRDAVVEGRLTLEEYSDRVGLAVAAKTDQDLSALVRDLPAGPGGALGRGPASEAPGGPLARGTAAAHRAVCSHLVRRGPLRLSPESSWLSLFGTIDLDLREATLPGPEVHLAIRNVFGTVTVIVPEGVDVQLDGGGLFASQHVDIAHTQRLPGAPVIHIHASGPGGTLYVRAE
jgi:hypothetical protein